MTSFSCKKNTLIFVFSLRKKFGSGKSIPLKVKLFVPNQQETRYNFGKIIKLSFKHYF